MSMSLRHGILSPLLLFLVTIGMVTIQSSCALNILVLGAVQTRSHFTFANAVTTTLLDRGHRIYELTSLQPKDHPNRTSFVMKDAINTYNVNLTDSGVDNLFGMVLLLSQWSVAECARALESEAAQQLLALARSSNRPRIDVVVHDYVFHECLSAFVPEFGDPPVVAMTAYGNSIEIDELVGGPTFPAFVPHDLVSYPPDKTMTWLQRLENKLMYVWADLVRAFYHFPEMDAATKRIFGPNASTIADYGDRVAIALVNAHPAFHGARPQLPSVVPVGGVHITPAKGMPAGDLKVFVDSAKDGLILMSFGSFIQTSSIEATKRKGLMRAFARLSPIKVLLKWEKKWDVDNDGPVPENVFLSPWFPQTDVLAHPNIRLFVTHCGGLSTNEVIRRPVPIVAIPFFMDQIINANHLVEMGMGRLLHYYQLTEDQFYETMKSVLDDDTYINRLRKLSAVVLDDINSPQEKVGFWVEYVARHGGAPHLRSPARRLPWISRWMIDDVIIFSIASLLVGFVFRRLCRLCSGTGKSKQKNE